MDANILRWTSLETLTRVGGTVRWTAPEMIEDAEESGLLRPTFESDVYSLASVMYEVSPPGSETQGHVPEADVAM